MNKKNSQSQSHQKNKKKSQEESESEDEQIETSDQSSEEEEVDESNESSSEEEEEEELESEEEIDSEDEKRTKKKQRNSTTQSTSKTSTTTKPATGSQSKATGSQKPSPPTTTTKPLSQQQQQQQQSTPPLQTSQVLPSATITTTIALNQPIRRLIIEKLEIENFKSYAGKVVLGPFHKCFSSVIGPNGSGKSNVLDSIRFVFGERAKNIRFNKISELIHNSSTHKGLTEAKVSVHFQDIIERPGEEAYEVVPNSQMIITRTANKNNQSKYFINGKQKTYEDVDALLKSKGIDMEYNRFIILQGEVEQIATMQPKAQSSKDSYGLLEYLEEIIGSNQYVEKIDEAYKKVEEMNGERSTILNRYKAVETELNGLEEAKDEAEEYLRIETELLIHKSIDAQLKRYKYTLLNNEKMDKRKELEEQLKKVKDSMESSRIKLRESEIKMKTENSHLEELERLVQKSKNEHATFQKKYVKYKEEEKHLKTLLKKSETIIQEETNRIEESEKTKEKCKKDIKKFETEAAVLPNQLVEEEKKLEKMSQATKGETAKLQEKMEEVQKELMPWSKKFSEIKSKVDIQESEIEVLSKDLNTSVHRLEDANKAMEDAKVTITKRTGEISKAKKELEQTKQEIVQVSSQLNERKQAEETVYRESLATRSKVEELKATLSESTSRNTVMNRLLKLKENGELPGIHGRLGDLGAIDKKYDVAVSTAAPSLDNIVVDATETAEKCIEVLRKENLGRATFIILDKIEYLAQYIDKFKGPQGVERLYDLIKMKNKIYSNAFYYAVRDTLIANDIDSATKIAFGTKGSKYRVVTLEGGLIEQSGAMSGGGNRVAKGAMGSKIVGDPAEDRKQLAKLNETLANLDGQLSKIREEKRNLEQSLQQLQRRKSDLEVELPKMEMDIKAAHKKQEELSKAIPALEQQIKISSAKQEKVDRIKQDLKADKKEYDSLKEQVDALEGSIETIRNKILNVGGSALKNQKALVEELQQKIDTTRHGITKANVQIKSLEKAVEKSHKALEQHKQEIEDLKTKQSDLLEKKEKLKKEEEECRKAYEENSDKVEEKKEEIKKLRDEYEEAKKIDDKSKSKEIDITNNLDTITKQIQENNATASKYTKRFEDLNHQKARLKIFEDDPDEPLLIYTDEQLEELSSQQEENSAKIVSLSNQREKLKNTSVNAIRDYRKKQADLEKQQDDLNRVTEERDGFKKQYDDLRKKRLDDFMAGFTIITLKLKEMYRIITIGGDAELELSDSSDPFSEGIVFSVRPPKKSWKRITDLSGGEKTLSSLALVFALHHYKPTPLYFMDEIDAALDYKNTSIIANYIKDSTKNAQFIIISLRNYMFELADRLVGIYKTDNCTKSITINPASFAETLKVNNKEKEKEKENNKENNNPNTTVSQQQQKSSPSIPPNSSTVH